jgi:amidase
MPGPAARRCRAWAQETTWLDATAQADLVRRGEVSPKDLVEAAIARIEAVNPQLDAVIRTRFDGARRDLPDGPFRGVPVLLKDLGCLVAGEATAFGVGPLRDMAWPVTSYLAEQFMAAGFVRLSRTNVPELGTTVTTEAQSFPRARNPWHPGHSAGGSSGDRRRRRPAEWCPSRTAATAADRSGSRPASAGWWVSSRPGAGGQGPVTGEAWAGGVVDGAVTRTVRDAARVLDVISARMPGEPYYPPPLPRPLSQEAGADPGRLRIGALGRPGGDGYYLDDPQCRAAVAGAARLLESLGHHVQSPRQRPCSSRSSPGTSPRSLPPTPRTFSCRWPASSSRLRPGRSDARRCMPSAMPR